MKDEEKLRSRKTSAATEATQDKNQTRATKQDQQEIHSNSFIHSSKFHWCIIVFLLLTTVIGTYQSFSIHSKSHPNKPIHQLNRLPSSSLISIHTIDWKSLPYFAQKSNFFNQTFVKLGWAWTSFVIWFHSIALASFYFGITTDHHTSSPNHSRSTNLTPANPAGQTPSHPSTHVPRIITLHLVASVIWVFLTQWFFGSSLIERILILSGAKCVPSLNLQSRAESDSDHQFNVLQSIYCEQRWGKKLPGLDPLTLSTHRPTWSGGIDVSGHTFLLSFSILIIISALKPSLTHLFKKDDPEKKISISYKIAIYSNLSLLILWWWMLLMTSLYFHGPTEKLFGLALGIGSWFAVESVVHKILA